MNRKEFIEGIALSAAAVAVGGISGNEAAAAEKIRRQNPGKHAAEELMEMRRKAAHRIRRVIVNNDGNDNRWDGNEDIEVITRELFLSKRSLPLAEAPVDTVFYCDGVTFVYLHRSSFCEDEHRMGKDIVNKYFHDHGTDPLQITVEYFHQHDKEVFWSMRTSQGEVCSSVISNNDEDYDNIYDDYGYFNLKNPLALAWSMLSGMAGYCSCENYDKWFCAE